jgi:hypothetical protein
MKKEEKAASIADFNEKELNILETLTRDQLSRVENTTSPAKELVEDLYLIQNAREQRNTRR